MNILGEAAHIHAASAGGPRFLPTMSAGERRSIQNAIWLCNGCATLVDRDIEAHPVALLQSWKAEAERLAALELNTRPPAHGDAEAKLLGALTGLPSKFIPTAIANTHQASAKALEQLDPRFQVESSYSSKKTTFKINAREDVSLKLIIPPERAHEWKAKVLSAIDDGLGFEIDASGVKAQGSPLLEQLIDGDAVDQPTIKVPSLGAAVRAKLTAVDQAGTRHPFDDISGQLFVGQAYLTFEGQMWEGLADLTIRLHRQKKAQGTFSISTDFDAWVDLDIRGLPYLEAITSFFRCADSGDVLDVAVFEQGRRWLGLHAKLSELSNDNGSLLPFLAYLTRASEVAQALNVSIMLPKQITVTKNDVDDLASIYAAVTAPPRLGQERLLANPSLTLTATDKGENIRRIREQSEPSVVMLEQSVQSELMIFGQAVQVPIINITFNGVYTRVLDERLAFDAGDSVRVELEPADGFWMSYELVGQVDPTWQQCAIDKSLDTGV